MTFSFSKLLPCSLLICLMMAGSLVAQTPVATPTPEPKERKVKQGYMRFWNMLPKEAGDLVLIKNTGKAEGEPVMSAEPRNYYSDYIPVPVGRYALKAVRSEQPEVSLGDFDVLLRSDVYVTFLASIVEGKLKVEMLDDTYDPTASPTGQLTIRQQFLNARVIISVAGSSIRSRELTFGETETIEGLPLKTIELKMTAVLANGQKQAWNTDVDFRTVRRAALLIIPDAYGRFRPRLAMSGNPKAPSPGAP